MNLFHRIKDIIITRKNFFKDKLSLSLLVVGLILNLSSWLYIYLNIKPQTEPIFLHYNIYYGVDLIGEWYDIYLYIPVVLLGIFFINAFFSYILYKRERKLAYLVESLNIFMQLSAVVASYLIVGQNI